MKEERSKSNFGTDTEAVSIVIGAVMIIPVLIILFTVIQASVVPDWNKKVENAQIEVTYNDMMFLPADIDDVARHGTPKSCTVHLGAQYPDRTIFHNPGPGVAGTLAVEEHAPISLTYKDDTGTYTRTYNTSRIVYELAGTINSPKLVYEHGVIITDWGTATLTTDEQTLIDTDENLCIPIVNGTSRSKSAIGAETLSIYPYLHEDAIGNILWVNITLDTVYADLWKNTILNDTTVLADLNLQNTSVCVDLVEEKIYINSTATPYISCPNQTATVPLYAGIIACSLENPAGGGSGGLDQVGDYIGTGDNVMSSGSQWWGIPNSDNVTEMCFHTIIHDQATDFQSDLNSDYIWISIVDDAGHWWKLIIDFKEPAKIWSIYTRSGTTSETSTYLGTPFSFSESSIIDVLSTSNYDKPDACYQNAGICDNNILVTYFGDDVNAKKTALISYSMTIE